MDEICLNKERVWAYCMVYLSPSMLACGSELRFSRRMTILAFDLGSESSASD